MGIFNRIDVNPNTTWLNETRIRRPDGVSIIDVRNLDALKFVASVADTYGSNGVTILPDLRLGVSNNGGALFLLTAVHSLLLFLRQQGGHGHSLHAA